MSRVEGSPLLLGGIFREQVAVGPGFLKQHILYVLCIG